MSDLSGISPTYGEYIRFVELLSQERVGYTNLSLYRGSPQPVAQITRYRADYGGGEWRAQDTLVIGEEKTRFEINYASETTSDRLPRSLARVLDIFRDALTTDGAVISIQQTGDRFESRNGHWVRL